MRPPVDGPMFIVANVVLAVVVAAGFGLAVWFTVCAIERRYRRR